MLQITTENRRGLSRRRGPARSMIVIALATMVEAGRELFVGTLNGERGRMRGRYAVDAVYESGSCAEFDSGGFPFESQLAGGCRHGVVGTRGAFENMRGLITFFDIIPDPGESGASNFLWAGHLRTTT